MIIQDHNSHSIALARITGAQDYTLLLGMPGTGKSSTIVQAVKALVAAGRSVLLMSYTNRCTSSLPMALVALAYYTAKLSISFICRCHALYSNTHQCCHGLRRVGC